jgi:hypothetical protein
MKFKFLLALFCACALVTGCDDKKDSGDDDKSEDDGKDKKKDKKKKKKKGDDDDGDKAGAPEECTAYFKMIEDCKDKLGPGYEGAKTAAKMLEDTPGSWEKAGMKGDSLKQAKESLGKSCKAAADALKATCK